MFNISSCRSQNSTAIISSTMNQPSHPPSSTFVQGGRALNKHNPTLTNKNQSEIISNPSNANHILQQKPKPKPKPKPKQQNTPTTQRSKNNCGKDNEKQMGRMSFSKTTELLMNATTCNTSKAGVDYVTPESSSRYLLDHFSEFEPVLKNTNPLPKPPSVTSLDQVVVLRVSLHCKGCENKLKKHLSTMSGVTSFNIDFSAKKVTVVGDVTPVQVLSSISKVKTAKLWSSTSSHTNTRNLQIANK